MKFQLLDIAKQFRFGGDCESITPFGNGHINDTYVVKMEDKTNSPGRYILQRINRHVFKDPVGLMQNITVVTSFMSQRITECGGDPLRESLNIIPTIFDTSFILSKSGEYWRAYHFIENACSYDIVENYNQVYEAGKTIGKFQMLMSDCPPEFLINTIPDFHHTANRFQNLVRAVENDEVNLSGSTTKEINFAFARSDQTGKLLDRAAHGDLPLRIAHNDTKFNNVLFDEHDGTGVCVIDLDTVMPGLSLYDFGDSIRSMANTAAEDEQDLSKVNFDIRIFEHFAKGYLSSAGSFLTKEELNNLAFSAILMTLECGMRFLTDHLEGNVYYKVSRKNHNLDRCRTQFKLVQDMEEQYSHMMRIVERVASNRKD